MRKLRALLNRHWNLICYLFFGVLTTVVNYLVYFQLLNWIGLSGVISNAVAWAVSVCFAFLTNKPFVFHSNDWRYKTVISEFTKFVGCRIGSGLMETGVILLFVDFWLFDGNVVKLISSVMVVIINYIGSKLLVFRK